MCAASFDETFELLTPRLCLRAWRDGDLESFLQLVGNPSSMRDFGQVMDPAVARAKFDVVRAEFKRTGTGRWRVVEQDSGRFCGFVGIGFRSDVAALGDHHEIGWRLLPEFWGQGYATEAARAALDDAGTRCGLSEILTYTAPDNLASQAVMKRLGLIRAPDLDFDMPHPLRDETWHGLVWRVP